MYLLYLGESGTHPDSERVVVGGIAVFERAAYWLKRDLEDTVARAFPREQADLSIHAPWLRASASARGLPAPYRDLDPNERRLLLDACFEAIVASRHPTFFATVVDKGAIGDGDPYITALEDVVSRFDLMLGRFHAANRTQRGIVVISETSRFRDHDRKAETPVSEGTQWGRTRNLSEVPLFAPANRTRLLQGAGLVTNEIWGRYEKGISRHFDEMLQKFDREGTRLHGLTHRTAGVNTCWCPACFSYRAASAAQHEGGGRGGGYEERGAPREDHYPPAEDRRPEDPPAPSYGDAGARYGSGGGRRYGGDDARRFRRPAPPPSQPPPERHDQGWPEGEDEDRQPESNENRPTPWDT